MSNAPEDDAVTGEDGPAQAAEVSPAEAEARAEDGAPDEIEVESSGDLATVEDASAPAEMSLTDALEAKVAALEKDKKDTYERLLRATADLDNFRKRARREAEDAKVDARTQVLRDILPVLDNMERALAHAESSDDAQKGIIDGVKLVMRQFSQALEKSDVKVIEAEGKGFDPNLHEAMSQVESADHPPGTVMQVLQAGYTIGARLLRPALVVVAKAPPAEEPAAGANGKAHEADAPAAGESDTGTDSGETES